MASHGVAANGEGYDDDEGSLAVIMVAKVKMAPPTEGSHFLPNWRGKK